MLLFAYCQLSSSLSHRDHKKYTSLFFFIFAAIVVAAGVFFNLYLKVKKKKVVRFRGLLLLTGMLWIGVPNLEWLSVLFVVLFFLEFQVKRPLEVGFTDDMVVINSLIKKKISVE